jgi:hypothetical protein
MADTRLTDQIKAVEQEIALRRLTYPKLVVLKVKTQTVADQEIAAMEAIRRSLQILQEYAKHDNWFFAHDNGGTLWWISKMGPELALEANNGVRDTLEALLNDAAEEPQEANNGSIANNGD